MGLPVAKVQALQLTFEGLLKLHKTDPEAFWEKLKGITTPREIEITSVVIDNMTASLKSVDAGLRQLNQLAGTKAAAGG